MGKGQQNSSNRLVNILPCGEYTAAWLAQLGEHRSFEREVVGSNPRPIKRSESLNN